MREFTIKEWEEKFEELLDCVEAGETIGIYNEITGVRCVFVPKDIYSDLSHFHDHDDAC